MIPRPRRVQPGLTLDYIAGALRGLGDVTDSPSESGVDWTKRGLGLAERQLELALEEIRRQRERCGI